MWNLISYNLCSFYLIKQSLDFGPQLASPTPQVVIMECCYKSVVILLFLFLSFLKLASSLFPLLPVYGYMITTSWDKDFLRSNQGRDHQARQNIENTCSLCNTIVQGGIEALHVHYLASHEIMATQMAAEDPNRPSTSSSQRFPLPPPANLTQLPSVTAGTSNPNNPAPILTQSQTPPFLFNPNLQVAGHSHSSIIIPPRQQDQVIINNNNGNAPPQNPPPLIQYVRRRRRENAQPNNYQNPWQLRTNQPAQDVIDMGSDFEDRSSDGEDIDFSFGL